MLKYLELYLDQYANKMSGESEPIENLVKYLAMKQLQTLLKPVDCDGPVMVTILDDERGGSRRI